MNFDIDIDEVGGVIARYVAIHLIRTSFNTLHCLLESTTLDTAVSPPLDTCWARIEVGRKDNYLHLQSEEKSPPGMISKLGR